MCTAKTKKVGMLNSRAFTTVYCRRKSLSEYLHRASLCNLVKTLPMLCGGIHQFGMIMFSVSQPESTSTRLVESQDYLPAYRYHSHALEVTGSTTKEYGEVMEIAVPYLFTPNDLYDTRSSFSVMCSHFGLKKYTRNRASLRSTWRSILFTSVMLVCVRSL